MWLTHLGVFFAAALFSSRTVALKNAFEAVIRLVTGVFVDLALAPRRRQFHRPWSAERRRVVNGDLVAQNVGRGARETFDQAQVLARPR